MSGVGPPEFDAAFRERLIELFRWRRDVRRFRTDPLAAGLLDALIDAACLAPSVGFSQPWRFVTVDGPARRDAVRASFTACNEAALGGYKGERAELYAKLKLEGLTDAPVQLAVFCDEGTDAGHGLGSRTMPEMLRYSVVAAVQTLWLTARAHGVGVGWVSILDPDAVTRALEVPDGWRLVAYLCIGYPVEALPEPELQRAGWQAPDPEARRVWTR
ncbi:5,6-dimethylbenzimidazole synthase [Azospirillum sp. TSO22-1]|uniref:5,6-dimethylbenzimidazole synthase n=1 Tax=Azospirillum sp. TSO22-1 TaxID=716789 RepID=UPI001FFE9C5A|nr:5,6-dimethylbenzimidazole synthase [Azospirillum sp. TSO22-1]